MNQISSEESLTEATECNLSVQEMSEAFIYLHKMCCFVWLVLCNACMTRIDHRC